MRVLIADDDAFFLRVLVKRLSAAGHEISTATTGAEASAALASFSPEVAVLDVSLPLGDGASVAANWPGPVLFLSARDLDRAEGPSSGLRAHLQKPVDLDAVVAAVEALGRGEQP